MIWALAIGILVGPFVRRAKVESRPGTEFASGALLKVGVALLGLSISLGQALSIGVPGVLIAVSTIAVTLGCTLWIGARLSIEPDLTLLIAFGSAICGASAIAAASAANRVNREITGYAIATISLFGTIGMLAIPFLAHLLGLSDHRSGIWIGASLQEVAQVAVAGTTISLVALKIATLVKLVRVAMLPVALITMRLLNRLNSAEGAGSAPAPQPLPPFVIAFLLLMLVRTVVPIPDAALGVISKVSISLQAAALAGIGLQVDLGDLKQRGAKPIFLGMIGSVTAASASLVGVILFT